MLTNSLKRDNFLPEPLYLEALALGDVPLSYGSKSNTQTDPHGHWSWKPVHDRRKNLANLQQQINGHRTLSNVWTAIHGWLQSLIKHDWVLIRCYMNAHTYGVDGYFHCDSDRHDEITVVVYLCRKWDRDWAGETVILEPNGFDTEMSVMPAPNRMVAFPSARWHCARAVSRKCNDLRKTLVFKCRPRRKESFELISQSLVGFGALNLNHGDGTLHDHLMRVFQLLDDHRHSTIAAAGAVHSIYGTNAFTKKLLEPNASNRSMVARLVGEYNESLAYMFSVIERPATLENSPLFRGERDGEQIMRRLKMSYDQSVDVTQGMLNDLALIECANLQDQDKSWAVRYPNIAKTWSAHVASPSQQLIDVTRAAFKDKS